ncbi:MAG: DUF58 domain-containing protein [Bacteroidota bacterium]
MVSDRTQEILKKVRKIEIKTRGLSNQLFSGGYHSAFKGRGMSFSEVRAYQYGDDVRTIDWNVTARLQEPHVKVFEEEREITVMLLVDISGSTFFGTQKDRDQLGRMKQDIIAEICAVISFSAINNNDKVGIMLFSDEVELFVPPKKGRNHILRIIREIVAIEPKPAKTNIADCLQHMSNMLKKRSVVFVISDFMQKDPNYKDDLSIARRRHDVVGLHIYDDREVSLPKMGLIRVQDAETNKSMWLNSDSKKVRENYQKWYADNLEKTRQTFTRSGADFISINTRESYVTALLNLFSMREKRR